MVEPSLVTYNLSSDVSSHFFNKTNSFLTSKGRTSSSNKRVGIRSLKLAVIDFLSLLENLSKFFNKVTDKAKNGKLVLNDYGKALNQLFPTIQAGTYLRAQEKIKNENNIQIKALDILKKKGVDAATALKMLEDPAMAAAVATGKITPEAFVKMATETKKATAAAKEFEAALKAVQFEADELAEGAAEQLSERFDFGFLEIERKAREAFKSINKMTPEEMELSVALDERSIDKIQNEIGDINSKIKSYNRTLDLIGRQETAITETYDQKIDSLNKQRDALESIKSINSFLISQQQKQLGIANALTQGDISAAAAAAQEMRAESAQEALNRMGSGLETAANNLEVQKQRELSSITAVVNGQKLTRKQIETEIVTLSDQIYNIEVVQLEPLQRQADLKRQLLSDLAFQIDREQKSLQINGMTRQEWNFIQQYVEASNKVSNSLKINIDGIATSSTTAAGAWASILESMKSASTLSFNAPGVAGAGGSTVTGTKVVDGRTVVTSTSGVGTPFGQAGSAGSTVTVKSGNTLSGIAKAAGVSLSDVIKANPQISNPNLIRPGQKINIPGKMYGGIVKPMSMGGMVPKYLANGGRIGSDSVPTMLTPGEFVMNKGATAEFGPMLSMLNESKYPSMIGNRSGTQVPVNNVSTSVSDNSTAVYNYNLGFSINGSNANANDIARVVMREIKNVDAQRVRGQRV